MQTCPDCKGQKVYRGLTAEESCSTCDGSGHIPDTESRKADLGPQTFTAPPQTIRRPLTFSDVQDAPSVGALVSQPQMRSPAVDFSQRPLAERLRSVLDGAGMTLIGVRPEPPDPASAFEITLRVIVSDDARFIGAGGCVALADAIG